LHESYTDEGSYLDVRELTFHECHLPHLPICVYNHSCCRSRTCRVCPASQNTTLIPIHPSPTDHNTERLSPIAPRSRIPIPSNPFTPNTTPFLFTPRGTGIPPSDQLPPA
jgi:hypothetical protein